MPLRAAWSVFVGTVLLLLGLALYGCGKSGESSQNITGGAFVITCNQDDSTQANPGPVTIQTTINGPVCPRKSGNTTTETAP